MVYLKRCLAKKLWIRIRHYFVADAMSMTVCCIQKKWTCRLRRHRPLFYEMQLIQRITCLRSSNLASLAVNVLKINHDLRSNLIVSRHWVPPIKLWYVSFGHKWHTTIVISLLCFEVRTKLWPVLKSPPIAFVSTVLKVHHQSNHHQNQPQLPQVSMALRTVTERQRRVGKRRAFIGRRQNRSKPNTQIV